MKLAKCWHYEPIEKKGKVNCPNCHYWTGKRCRDEALINERYEESAEFEVWDRMMRGNRGIVVE